MQEQEAGYADELHPDAGAALNYYADIKPLLTTRCLSCHSAHGIAPFALGSYEEVVAVGAAVAHAVQQRDMPPWPADGQCREYQGDLSLSDAEIARIASWVEQGMRKGEPREERAAPSIERVALERNDLHLQMDEPHVPAPAQGTIDEHFCFLIDWPERDTKYITGFETLPGNVQVLHHFVGLIVAPEAVPLLQLFDALSPDIYGAECGAGSGLPGTSPSDDPNAGSMPLDGVSVFAVWVPGQGPVVYPKDSGIKVVPGSKILLNMHYNVAKGNRDPDRTAFNFQLADHVEREGSTLFVSDAKWLQGDNMLIPAGRSSVVFESSIALGTWIKGPSRVHHAMLHMHQLGSAGSLGVQTAARGDECMLRIPRWDFHWQLNYQFARPVDVSPEDSLRIRCEFDNSPEHQPLFNGTPRQTRDVRWGENTFDEMCLGLLYVTPR